MLLITTNSSYFQSQIKCTLSKKKQQPFWRGRLCGQEFWWCLILTELANFEWSDMVPYKTLVWMLPWWQSSQSMCCLTLLSVIVMRGTCSEASYNKQDDVIRLWCVCRDITSLPKAKMWKLHFLPQFHQNRWNYSYRLLQCRYWHLSSSDAGHLLVRTGKTGSCTMQFIWSISNDYIKAILTSPSVIGHFQRK